MRGLLNRIFLWSSGKRKWFFYRLIFLKIWTTQMETTLSAFPIFFLFKKNLLIRHLSSWQLIQVHKWTSSEQRSWLGSHDWMVPWRKFFIFCISRGISPWNFRWKTRKTFKIRLNENVIFCSESAQKKITFPFATTCCFYFWLFRYSSDGYDVSQWDWKCFR